MRLSTEGITQRYLLQDKSMQNEIYDSVAHMPAIHGRRSARCFFRDSGNIASDISGIIKKYRMRICPLKQSAPDVYSSITFQLLPVSVR